MQLMEMSFFRTQVHALVRDMAREMRDARVSCVAPGCSRVSRVITRMGREAPDKHEGKASLFLTTSSSVGL